MKTGTSLRIHLHHNHFQREQECRDYQRNISYGKRSFFEQKNHLMPCIQYVMVNVPCLDKKSPALFPYLSMSLCTFWN